MPEQAPPAAPSPDHVVTYVLVGYDHNGAFKDGVAELEKRPDVVILRAAPGETLEDTVRKIKPPANVILEAHGGPDGGFDWHEGGDPGYSINYAYLASLLPPGIQSLGVGSCYGGTAQNSLWALKPGMLLYSQVGDKTASYSGFETQYAKELGTIKGPLSPTDVILRAIDSVDVDKMNANFTFLNNYYDDHPDEAKKKGFKELKMLNASDVVPHIIGIGGDPPLVIDLNDQVKEIARKAGEGHLDTAAFDRATAMVKERCETMSGSAGETVIDKALLAVGIKTNAVDSVANKLKSGVDPATLSVQEQRIAYALSVAYLDTSGELNRLVDIAKSQPAERTQPKQQATWNADHGTRNLATLQAMLELGAHLATDAGGADDHRVTGIMNDQTREAIRLEERKYGITNDDGMHSKLMAAMLRDPDVIKALGTVKDGAGHEAANMPTLGMTYTLPAPGPTR